MSWLTKKKQIKALVCGIDGVGKVVYWFIFFHINYLLYFI